MMEEDIRKRWVKYFSSLFNESPSKESRPEGIEEVVSSSPHMHYDRYYSRINQGKMRAALQKMGRNKVVGPDHIPIEAWRCLEDEGVNGGLAFLIKSPQAQRCLMNGGLVKAFPFRRARATRKHATTIGVSSFLATVIPNINHFTTISNTILRQME
ncbi:hypothetical protein Tco_0896160 [Tanacetum coccineum]